MLKSDFDVAVVGGGPVGLAFAGWLASVWGVDAHRIALFDAKSLTSAQKDPRTLALSDATRLRLMTLGFPAKAVPIHHIHVSEQARFGQVRMSADELGLRALGWTVNYGELVSCLAKEVQKTGVQIFRPASVKLSHRLGHQSQEVLELEDGREFTVNLRVDAEGGLYGETVERDHVVDYNQWALVCEVVAEVDSSMLDGTHTLAFERFTEEGPVALLPIDENQKRYSLVWCASKEQTDRRLCWGERAFSQELRRVFGRRVRIHEAGPRLAFPLGMNWRDQIVQGRRVAIGNAAQILHPVAGQGLNLGLRDAATLVRYLNKSWIESESKLTSALLAFEQSRKLDRRGVVKATDLMVKSFSTSNPLLGLGRQVALNLMEYTPIVRKQFAQAMLFGLAS